MFLKSIYAIESINFENHNLKIKLYISFIILIIKVDLTLKYDEEKI